MDPLLPGRHVLDIRGEGVSGGELGGQDGLGGGEQAIQCSGRGVRLVSGGFHRV